MNRIAGILTLDRTLVDPGMIDLMLDRLKLGVDDAGSTWVSEGVGLGCTQSRKMMGKPVDLLLASRPDLQCAITFDGRIDNRKELLTALGPQLANGPRPIPEEQIVLAAYEKWGLECPRHLIGDFAFAIWDASKRQLVCVRDHFGVKPLYYHVSERFFLFGSTPQALLASGKIPFMIDEGRIADFLVNPLEGMDKTSSFYSDVHRLPPAHRLIMTSAGIRLERYWELCTTRETEFGSDDDHVEAFRDLFAESVRCRLQDSGMPASMLSGGMDSSAIVGVGRKLLDEEGKHLQVFSVISNFPDTNRETPHILSIIDQGKLQSHLVSETELPRWMNDLVKSIETEAEPFDCLMNLNRLVYLQAREQGADALLDGIDGDVLLSGSGHLAQLWKQGAFRAIIDETFGADGLTAEYKMGRNLFLNSLLSAITPIAPDWFRNLRRPIRYGKVLRSALRDTLIEREFADRSRLGERFTRLDSYRLRAPAHSQAAAHKIAFEHPFLTVGLERYERVASAFGIEARHPYTDVRLVEFCLSLPWQLKTRRGWTKMILRRAMEPLLPAEVVWRKDKDSLMWEINRLILKEKAGYFYQITQDEREHLKPYINLPKLLQFWDDYLTRSDEKETESLWVGTALAMWLQQQRRTHAARS